MIFLDIFDTTSSPVKNDVDEMSDLFASLGDADISRTPTKNVPTSEDKKKKKELSDFTPLSGTNEGDHEKKQSRRKKKKNSKSRKKKKRKKRKVRMMVTCWGDLCGSTVL